MKRSILTLILLSLAVGLQAQSAWGINLKSYDPKAQFNRNVDHAAFGLSVSYLKGYEDSRWSWGGEFGVAMYSSDHYDIEFRGRTLEIMEEDCFFTLHGFVRYDMIDIPSFKVYSEARIGLTTFFSTTDAVEENTGFDGAFDFHGSAFNTGAGIGVMVNPGALFSKDKIRGNWWIDLAVNAHSGSSARYRMHPEGDGVFSLDDGQHRSMTHYMGYRLGFVFGL